MPHTQNSLVSQDAEFESIVEGAETQSFADVYTRMQVISNEEHSVLPRLIIQMRGSKARLLVADMKMGPEGLLVEVEPTVVSPDLGLTSEGKAKS